MAGTGDETAASSSGTIDALRRLATGGDPSAQYRLAHLCLIGDMVPHDPAEGLRWMKEAATNGEVDASFELG